MISVTLFIFSCDVHYPCRIKGWLTGSLPVRTLFPRCFYATVQDRQNRLASALPSSDKSCLLFVCCCNPGSRAKPVSRALDADHWTSVSPSAPPSPPSKTKPKFERAFLKRIPRLRGIFEGLTCRSPTTPQISIMSTHRFEH